MKIEECELRYSQPSDCCGDGDDQELVVKVMDGGGGPYLTIETHRWSFDSTTEFINQMEHIYSTLRTIGVYVADDKTTDRS